MYFYPKTDLDFNTFEKKRGYKNTFTTNGLAAGTGRCTQLPCIYIFLFSFLLNTHLGIFQLIKPKRNIAAIYGWFYSATKINDLTNK